MIFLIKKECLSGVLLALMVALSIQIFGQNAIYHPKLEYEIISDSSGIYTANTSFSPENLHQKSKWQGDWIWLDKSIFKGFQNTSSEWIKKSPEKKQYKALFRKSLTVEEAPSEAILSITGDVSYRLFVNGTFVCDGPPNIGSDYFDSAAPEHWFFNSINITKYVTSGNNVLAAEVYGHTREISETTSGKGKFICNLETELGEYILGSDTTWKCAIDTALKVVSNGFYYDATREIKDWTSPDFDDSNWATADVTDTIKQGFLIRSKIPLTFRKPVQPVAIKSCKEKNKNENDTFNFINRPIFQDCFTIDNGKNMTGYYKFVVQANQYDTMRIIPYEKSIKSPNRALNFVCRDGKNSFYSPFLSVFRYLQIEIVSTNGLEIQDFEVEFSSYPVNYAGAFDCSDPQLTKLWNITRWTTQLCMNDMFYDSPNHQEPNACTGDYFIESLISFYAFGDPWLCRQTLVKTALMLEKNNFDMFHTSYSLLWVQMLNQYFQFTGDTALVKELLPYVNQLNTLFETYLDQDFLVSNAPDYMFMDWIKIDKFNAHHPPAVIGMGYMTAFYYKSLLDAATLNGLFKNETTIDHNRKLAEKIKSSFNQLLWDKEKGLYRDGLAFRSKASNHWFFPPDEDIVTYSPHVNTLAVLYDIAPNDKQPLLMDYVLHQKDIDLQPYFTFFVLSALSHIQQFETKGLELMKKWENGIDTETFTLKENWQDVTETGYRGDYSHAWGGSPLYFLSREILGVRPGSPGFGVIEIEPFISDQINWAKGSVPVNEKTVMDISWQRVNMSTYQFNIVIPGGFTGLLRHPVKFKASQLKVNNKLVGISGKSLQLSEGSYFIEYKILQE